MDGAVHGKTVRTQYWKLKFRGLPCLCGGAYSPAVYEVVWDSFPVSSVLP